MAISRTIRDALDQLPGRAKAIAGWDGSDVQVVATDSSGYVRMVATGPGTANGVEVQATTADGRGGQFSLNVMSFPYLYNGSTFDRQRPNVNETILASAARTATNNTSDLTNYNARGLHLVINVSAVTATPSVTFTIQGKDEVSGSYYTVLASAAITGTGTTVLKVYPGLTAAANTVANDVLPRTWRLLATHADADSITYSVGASLIV